MSNSPPPLQQLEQEQTRESDAVFDEPSSLNQKPPNQPDPPPETILPNLDSGYNSAEEDEEGEETEELQHRETPAISSGMSLHIDPPITDPHVSLSDTALTSPSGDPSTRRGGWRKKGKGKGKTHARKQQAIEEKLQILVRNLTPIPFIPTRIPDFAKHEKLLQKLGLWDFVHIVLDRNIRVDLIAQLVATYEPKLRACYVNGYRFMVNRADLARAFKLPLKKERGNAGGMEVDLDSETLSEDSIGFVVEILSKWVLLHEDMWMMPNEVADWLKLIKDGQPEKVDWAGLLWLMVEKELKQGAQLKDCYYAAHLQHLLKFQREEVMLLPPPEDFGVDGEAKEEVHDLDMEKGVTVENGVDVENVKDVDSVATPREEDLFVGGPSTELTLGQDGEKEDGVKDVEMMDSEKFKESDEEGGEEEQGQWLLNGKNDLGEHIMQRCGAVSTDEISRFDFRKDDEEEMDGEEEREEEIDGEEDEEETENEFHVYANDGVLEGDGYTGNLLEGVEGNHMAFSSQDLQLHDPSSMDVRGDLQHMSSAPSFFNNSGKRVLEHDNDITHHSIDDSNKRLRINDSWDNKALDFGMCMDQFAQIAERAKALYMEKEHATAHANMNQQLLLNELQKRDSVIELLHKARLDEAQKKDGEIFRLERELHLMGGVLDGYRKALKDVQTSFAEYRERANLAEESTYKDTEEGGLMLTASELEKLHKKREEEYKMKCIILEHNIKEVAADLHDKFNMFVDKVNLLDKKLTGLEADAKELITSYAKRKISPTEEKVAEVSESLPDLEQEEEMADVSESLPDLEQEEKVADVSESLPDLEQEEKVAEVSESLPDLEQEEEVAEVSEPLPNPETEENVGIVSEALPNPEPEEKVAEVVDSAQIPKPEPEEKVPEVVDSPQIPEAKSPETNEKVAEVSAEVAEPSLNEMCSCF